MTPEVQRGAALLDEVRPEWEKEIDLSDFEISGIDNCILGQLYGSFGAGITQLGWLTRPGKWDQTAHDHACYEHGDGEHYQQWQLDWIKAINERLNPLYVPESFLPTQELVSVG